MSKSPRRSSSPSPSPPARLSHINDKGEAHMVDVSAKSVTQRTAIAQGFVSMEPATLALIETGQANKGDVLATARIAGIMAAKKTHELIPLCHPLAITKATVDFASSNQPSGIEVTALVKVSGQTGVEMEALTAVSIACLTIYDMLKAADKAMTFSDIKLVEKTGGRSGRYRAGKPSRGSQASGATAPTATPKSPQKRASDAPPPAAPGDPPPAAAGDPPPAASGDPPWDI